MKNKLLLWILKIRGYQWGDKITNNFDKMIWRFLK